MAKKSAIEARIRVWQQLIKDLGADAVASPLTTIPERPQSLARAFEQFSLNPQQPNHRELLCIILADLLFGHRKVGRKKGRAPWHGGRLLEYALAYEKIRSKNPKISDSEAAKEIKRNGASRGATAETIRQQLPAARQLLNQMTQYLEPRPAVKPIQIKARAPSGGWLNL
jgi:hypothetical protein